MSTLLPKTFLHFPRYSTAVQRIDYPMHKGKPNPAHGMFFLVGSIPAGCWDATRNDGQGGSVLYATEFDAITAAIKHGAEVLQRCDCSLVDIPACKASQAQYEATLAEVAAMVKGLQA